LVLDEPTNDLDVDTLDLLQEVLVEFRGTLLLVSHDRDFLDRLVTSVIVFEGDGRLQEYAGGYGDMMRQRAAPAPSARPPATAPSPPSKVRKDAAPLRVRDRARRDLDRLLGQVEALTAEIRRLEDELADPDLFRRNPEAFAARTTRLARARGDLQAAEQRWLDLAAPQEQVT
jgi:ATP-binding cassette subfamily F protein uup